MFKVCGFCVKIQNEIMDIPFGVVLSFKRWAQPLVCLELFWQQPHSPEIVVVRRKATAGLH